MTETEFWKERKVKTVFKEIRNTVGGTKCSKMNTNTVYLKGVGPTFSVTYTNSYPRKSTVIIIALLQCHG